MTTPDYSNRPTGPNVKKLIFAKMAKDAVPAGGNVYDALHFLQSPDNIAGSTKEAAHWVFTVIDAVKAAKDNTLPDDESIATEILRRMEERKQKDRKNP
jgi:hypothetical protein